MVELSCSNFTLHRRRPQELCSLTPGTLFGSLPVTSDPAASRATICFVNFSWGDLSKPLLSAGWTPMTDQSNHFSKVQLGEPMSLLGLLIEHGWWLHAGV